MLISIVTAVYNRASTVGEAIASVRAQTHPAVEHIIQDGGSSDGTLEVISAERHPDLHLVSAPDRGIYDAINKGIERAAGDVIGLVHSDDFLAAPNILSLVAQAFTDIEVDAVYGDLDYVAAEDTGRIIRRWRSCAFTPELLARGWMPPHPTLFLRREVFAQHGAYDTSFRIAADYDAILRWFGEPGFRAVHVPEVFVKMRTGGASNASLRHLLRKSREDYRALRANRVGGIATLARKNLQKVRQFL